MKFEFSSFGELITFAEDVLNLTLNDDNPDGIIAIIRLYKRLCPDPNAPSGIQYGYFGGYVEIEDSEPTGPISLNGGGPENNGGPMSAEEDPHATFPYLPSVRSDELWLQ